MGRVEVRFTKPNSIEVESEMHYNKDIHSSIRATKRKFGQDIEIVTTVAYPNSGWVCPPEWRALAPSVRVKRKRGRFGRISYDLDES